MNTQLCECHNYIYERKGTTGIKEEMYTHLYQYAIGNKQLNHLHDRFIIILKHVKGKYSNEVKEK